MRVLASGHEVPRQWTAVRRWAVCVLLIGAALPTLALASDITEVTTEWVPPEPTTVDEVVLRLNYTSSFALEPVAIHELGPRHLQIDLQPLPCLITCPPQVWSLDLELGVLGPGQQRVDVVLDGLLLTSADVWVEVADDRSPQLEFSPQIPTAQDFVTAAISLEVEDCNLARPEVVEVVADLESDRWHVDVVLLRTLGGPPCEPAGTRLGTVVVPLGALPLGSGDVRVFLRTLALPESVAGEAPFHSALEALPLNESQLLVERRVEVEAASGSVLLGGRFEVSATFADDDALTTRPALVVPVRRSAGQPVDSALFGFYQQSNWELLVKVLDGCTINDRFWVFSAAATDLGWRVQVRDRVTGATYSTEQRLGVLQPPTTDTEALAVCG